MNNSTYVDIWSKGVNKFVEADHVRPEPAWNYGAFKVR